MSSTPIANDLPMLGGASFSAGAPTAGAPTDGGPAVGAPAPADAPAVSDLPAPAPELSSVRQAIEQAIGAHKVILFMKGTPEAPACGFSARTVAALQSLEVPFAAVDVLPDPRIRQELSAISNWPTIPQLFANGELVGGCDIVTEMYESGELAETLQ
jgi:monothiol glutaredoxin